MTAACFCLIPLRGSEALSSLSVWVCVNWDSNQCVMVCLTYSSFGIPVLCNIIFVLICCVFKYYSQLSLKLCNDTLCDLNYNGGQGGLSEVWHLSWYIIDKQELERQKPSEAVFSAKEASCRETWGRKKHHVSRTIHGQCGQRAWEKESGKKNLAKTFRIGLRFLYFVLNSTGHN